uniref:Hemerythrin n=1 Tax=Aspidosiphon laevis TaxID=210791 RepID=A0A1S6QCT3_9ANNE|nr:hemerythrin [Aspidosiphon laevis]
MGFEIPEPFVWDESFMVFYEELDEEHKGLFQACFDMSKDKTSKKALEKFQQVISDHFVNEETYMIRAIYPALMPHKRQHDAFLHKIEDWEAPVSDVDVIFAKDWLVNHIKTTDFKYIGKLYHAKGVTDR